MKALPCAGFLHPFVSDEVNPLTAGTIFFELYLQSIISLNSEQHH
jgi:hypothetical protein